MNIESGSSQHVFFMAFVSFTLSKLFGKSAIFRGCCSFLTATLLLFSIRVYLITVPLLN